MNTNDKLDAILQSLARIEKLVAPAAAKVVKSSAEAVLREKLKGLTIKRHAVLTATLGGLGYAEMAKLMQCDLTTVKLHLKAAMTALDIPSRGSLLVQHKQILDPISDKEYELNYGVSKRWWLEQKPQLMAVLRATKPTANQHTKGKT